ncbi:MAG: lipoprotein-releasing system transmembrane subunit LolC [Gammaproteobacteria bacterium]|nr:lipoprotein-releasing system transmembrane subunit LolC [Gammaproteobacteria bacterium]
MNFLPLNIAFKYFRSKRRGYLSFVSGIAFIGIALGVSVLILVSSVMNGFERELRERVLESIPHASVVGNIEVKEFDEIRSILLQNLHVIGASPYIETQGLISSESSLKGVYLFGISPEYEKEVSIIGQRFLEGGLEKLTPGNYGLLIGDILAAQLNLRVNDFVNVLVPDTSSGLVGTFPRTKRFRIVGIFNTGSTEVDQSYVYLHISNAAKLLRMKNFIHGVRVKYSDLFLSKKQVLLDVSRINHQLGKFYSTTNWTYSYGTLFKAIKMEKFLVSLLLSAIILVAVFNVVSMLVMTINEKRSQIAIIMTIGGTKNLIEQIFLYFGSLIGITGTFLGLIFGLLVTIFLGPIIEFLEFILNKRFLEIYFIDYFPIDIRLSWVCIICLASISLTILASYYPATLASKLEPAEVLRHE